MLHRRARFAKFSRSRELPDGLVWSGLMSRLRPSLSRCLPHREKHYVRTSHAVFVLLKDTGLPVSYVAARSRLEPLRYPYQTREYAGAAVKCCGRLGTVPSGAEARVVLTWNVTGEPVTLSKTICCRRHPKPPSNEVRDLERAAAYDWRIPSASARVSAWTSIWSVVSPRS
jgi:hypothetical protein